MFQLLGKRMLTILEDIGNISLLATDTILKLFTAKKLAARTIDQMYSLGVKSLPLTIITASFVGMAFTVQVTKEFLKFGAGDMIGGIVGLAIWRELGPLLTGVVFCGRVGAAIAAEIGSMKVTEQVDALRALSQNTTEFLVAPRFLACVFVMPLLVGFADIVGFMSGFFIAVSSGNINPYAYFNSAQSMLSIYDITGGLIKGACFGFLVAIQSCYVGLKTRGGAQGVGSNTTKAVVMSLVSIFIVNYFLSVALN